VSLRSFVLPGATVGDLTALQHAGLQDSAGYHVMAMSRLGRDLQILVDLNLLIMADGNFQVRQDSFPRWFFCSRLLPFSKNGATVEGGLLAATPPMTLSPVHQAPLDHNLYVPVKQTEQLYINLHPKIEEPKSSYVDNEGYRWRMFDIEKGESLLPPSPV